MSNIKSYILKHENEDLLTFTYNGDNIKIENILGDETKLPTLVRKSSLENWIITRSIDIHRTNSRLLAKMLRLRQGEIIENVLKVHASSLTDNYWIKETDDKMTYEELIARRRDTLSNVALLGEFDFDLYDDNSLTTSTSITPELTLGGSYEKCWKYDKSIKQWFMVKKGSPVETFNELIACEIANLLGIHHVNYDIYNNNPSLVRCNNFVTNIDNKPIFNYEPFMSYVFDRDDDEDFDLNIEILESLSDDIRVTTNLKKDYMNMLLLDCIILNSDRHTENYGIIRSVSNNKVIGLAPLFDHNLSLLKSNIRNIETGDSFIENIYIPFLKKNYNGILRIVSKEDIENVVNKVWSRVFNLGVAEYDKPRFDREFITNFIYHKYELLRDNIQ